MHVMKFPQSFRGADIGWRHKSKTVLGHRQEMIATIPGWNRARARAVLDACQDGTFAEVVSLSSNELARILVAGEPGLAKDTELKTDLVKALKRVIQ